MRLIALVLCLVPSVAFSFQIPKQAFEHKRYLIREVRANHGLNGPIALHAAIIHQESRWVKNAKSPVGASGLAQFMPKTAEWMGEIDSRLLGAKTLDPRWSIRAMAVYTAWLLDRVDAKNECENWAFALSGYNGGIGWVWKDQKLSETPGVWFGGVSEDSERADWAFNENRHYVSTIIKKWQPGYYGHGFGFGEYICGEL